MLKANIILNVHTSLFFLLFIMYSKPTYNFLARYLIFGSKNMSKDHQHIQILNGY